MKANKYEDLYKLVLILVLLAVAMSLSTGLSRFRAIYFPTNIDRPVGIQLLTEAIGEVRTILASYIYIRADMYHHEREDKVDWRHDPATLPLYRLVTALDPKMVQAYDFGAYHLAVNFKKYDEGIKFLQEGLRYNPDSSVLYSTMGDIYYFKGDYKTAAKNYAISLDLTVDPVEVKNAIRRLYWSNRQMKKYNNCMMYLYMWYNLEPKDPLIKRFYDETVALASGKKTEKDFGNIKPDEKRKKEIEEELHERSHGHTHDESHDEGKSH